MVVVIVVVVVRYRRSVISVVTLARQGSPERVVAQRR